MNKNMLETPYSLPTGTAWEVNPWDLLLVKEGCQISLLNTRDGAAGLGESLIEFQIVSPLGPWVQFLSGCSSEPSLIFSPRLKHSGCLATLNPSRLSTPGPVTEGGCIQ